MAANSSVEQLHIVRTVVGEFLPAVAGQPLAERLFTIVRKGVEQKAGQAATRCELMRVLTEIGQQADGELLDLCIETANNLVNGYERWVLAQTDIDEYPALQLLDF